jgi:hypothetical protein
LIEQDYILRLAKQMAQLLTKALQLSRDGQHPEAQTELESASTSLLNLPLDMIERLDIDTLIPMLGPEKCMAAAELLEARAELFERRGEPANAARRRVRAATLRECFDLEAPAS